MADPTRTVPAPIPAASAPEFVATFAAVLVAIVVFLFVDMWLARVDREESRVHAANLYADGRALLARHDPSDARERFASAAAIDRTNVAYQLGLAEAMLAQGQPAEAEHTLRTALDRAETDGAANLMMARVLVSEGRDENAKSYFHRAVYGQWGDDSTARRLQARFELIALLSRRHAHQELLAELLPIEEIAPDSVALRRRLGHLFIDAGSPARGVEIFRQLLRQSPNDADAYAGMGEAALALGNFRTARADLAIAARLLPGDSAIARQLQLADTVLQLDPQQRGISAEEQARRSRNMLALTLSVLDRCPRARVSRPSGLADSAQRLMQQPLTSGGAARADSTEALAAELWSTRADSCAANGSLSERALELIQSAREP